MKGDVINGKIFFEHLLLCSFIHALTGFKIKQMEVVKMPRGFLFSGIRCGIKKKRRDLGIIISEEPATVAAVFTKNKFRAAPVIVSHKRVSRGVARGIVVNSGNANAATGQRGIEDAVEMTKVLADLGGFSPERILVASTGVIGVPLPMDRIKKGIELAYKELRPDGVEDFAEAILTTDTRIKVESTTFTVDGVEVEILGIAKGAGMIEPDMATMLAFIITDAAIEKDALKAALKKSVDMSFNRISVDGCQSTNDSVFIFANGQAGNRVIKDGQSFEVFLTSLMKVTHSLAMQILKDGEGVKTVFSVEVADAATREEAERIARKVANSNLVKTAIYGKDPNFGRILAAAGSVQSSLVPEKTELYIDDTLIFKNGVPVKFEKNQVFGSDFVKIKIVLNTGSERAIVYGTDLTEDYVRFNAHYTT